MAGLRGNSAWIAFQKQPKKGELGTLSATTTMRFPYSAGSLQPAREIASLTETDANRDQGVSYVKKTEVKGNPEVYVRDASIGALLLGVLGTDVITKPGAEEYTHEITPNNSLPYFTIWTGLSETLFERHENCFIGDLEFKATAGSPLTAQATILGTATKKLPSDIVSGTVPLQSGTVYNYNNAKVKLGAGGETALIDSMTLSIQNNVVTQQTDTVTPLDVAVGKRVVNCSFGLIFESLEEYENFIYGESKPSSELSVSSKLYKTSLKYTYELSASHSIQFTIPQFAYEEFPVAPEVQGAPIVVPVKGVAQRTGTAEPVITTITKNATATY